MSLVQIQERLATGLLRIEDPLERLAYLQDRARRNPSFDEVFRTEVYRIQGCTTKLWLHSTLENGLCQFAVDSESGVVRGLAALLAEVYSGASPAEVGEFECTIFAAVKLESRITPTRLNGLALLQKAIRNFAMEQL